MCCRESSGLITHRGLLRTACSNIMLDSTHAEHTHAGQYACWTVSDEPNKLDVCLHADCHTKSTKRIKVRDVHGIPGGDKAMHTTHGCMPVLQCTVHNSQHDKGLQHMLHAADACCSICCMLLCTSLAAAALLSAATIHLQEPMHAAPHCTLLM
jgi:hypothetical protein